MSYGENLLNNASSPPVFFFLVLCCLSDLRINWFDVSPLHNDTVFKCLPKKKKGEKKHQKMKFNVKKKTKWFVTFNFFLF